MGNEKSNAHAVWLLVGMILAAGAPVYAQEETAPDTDTDTDTVIDAVLHPPHLVAAPPPDYPPGREGEGLHPTVILRITVTADARVVDVVVEHSGGVDFDAQAVKAVKGWAFEPARRGDTPVSSRVRVAVHFEPESAGVPHEGQTHEPQAAPHTAPAAPLPNEPAAVSPAVIAPGPGTDKRKYGSTAEVDAERLRSGDRGAADFQIDRRVLDAAPVLTATDLLQRVPGLYSRSVGSPADGDFFYLRGFNAEHGQDIEFKLGDIPINQPSNVHGQGYTYLNFIIPEAVRDLRVLNGVYDPRQGDFAVAGTVQYDLGVADRGIYARSELGSFRTFRQIGIFAPEGKHTDTFGAFQFRRTDGFGQNRSGIDGSAMFQFGFGKQDWRFRVHGSFWGARYDSAGVLRRDDIQTGEIGFYDVYPFDTARAQEAFNAGGILGFRGEHRGAREKNTSFDLWLQLLDYRIEQNFTGFLESPEGDLIEQRDRRFVVGGNARHRTARFTPSEYAHGTVELGVSGRFDFINPQQQFLIDGSTSQTTEEIVDANIVQGDVGLWVDLDWDFSKYINLKGGVRADVLFFDVEDRIVDAIPNFEDPESFAGGFRRTAAGINAGPRITLTGRPTDWIDIIGAYGEGFRSPQARTLLDGGSVPFSKVRSVDFGVRFRVGPEEQLKLSLTGYRTWLNRDVFFEAAEGQLEEIGPTSRTGALFYATTNPLPWLSGAISVTYVYAILEGPPPGEPDSGLGKGDRLPFVPPWTVRLDVGASGDLADLGKHPLRGHLGLAYSFIGARPLPFSGSADPFSLLDGSARLSWWFLELGFQVFNLTDKQYAGNELAFESNWDPLGAPSPNPARHITAGRPRTFFFTIGIRL